MTPRPPRYAEPPTWHTAAVAAPALGTGVPVDLAQTQGFVVRGYNFRFIRYFALTVRDPEAARAFIASLVSGESAWPQVTLASAWVSPKPDRCLNIGFTYRGLAALGVPAADLTTSFGADTDHYSFQLGAKAQAGVVGDVGLSDPGHWRIDDSAFDVMLVVWGEQLAVIEQETERLATLLAPGFEPLRPDRQFDSQALDDRRVWFGYRDGIAQPHVAHVPYPMDNDGGQQLAGANAFMLGTTNDGEYPDISMTTPPALGLYGCFGAFRILEQDVDGFEAQVVRLSQDPAFRTRYGITDPAIAIDAVKALICGRWPNGVSLAVFPIDGDNPPPTLLASELNNFLYQSPTGPEAEDIARVPDDGQHCPIGAHTRRGNMRGWPDADTPSVYHRIIRRAAAYQLPFPPQGSDPGERGLVGFFMGSSLAKQFEFVQQNWINNWSAETGFNGVKDTNDGLIGTGNQTQGSFHETIGHGHDRWALKGMQSFVRTRGSAYCFFPGIPGIRWIAEQTGPSSD